MSILLDRGRLSRGKEEAESPKANVGESYSLASRHVRYTLRSWKNLEVRPSLTHSAD